MNEFLTRKNNLDENDNDDICIESYMSFQLAWTFMKQA